MVVALVKAKAIEALVLRVRLPPMASVPALAVPPGSRLGPLGTPVRLVTGLVPVMVPAGMVNTLEMARGWRTAIDECSGGGGEIIVNVEDGGRDVHGARCAVVVGETFVSQIEIVDVNRAGIERDRSRASTGGASVEGAGFIRGFVSAQVD